MPQRYKLLLIDIDGTLLDGTGDVSDENRSALAEAGRTGVHIGLCTGRAIKSSRKYIEELGLAKNYHVFYDGAFVTRLDAAEALYANYVNPAIVRELVEYAEAHGIDLQLASAHQFYSRCENWETDIKRDVFGLDVIIGDIGDICLRENIIRIDIGVREPDEEDRVLRLFDHFGDKVQHTTAFSPLVPEARFFNIVAPGQSKGHAVTVLAAHLGITVNEVMAVGDWLNDIPLLETAGLGGGDG